MWRRLPIHLSLSLFFACSGLAQQLSALAPPPKWGDLEAYQETITHDEFAKLLDEVYAPRGAAKDCIEVQPTAAVIKTALAPAATWTLRFAATEAEAKAPARYWRTPAQLGPAPAERPLAGLKIALDPGHLGGTYAKMEERFFQVAESRPVIEGEMTLRVAKMLAPKLEALGAEVQLVRAALEPVTPRRPATLREEARAELAREPGGLSLDREAELLFYRRGEIRDRAVRVNETLKPDLTLCLHFNAEGWGDPKHPSFVPRNHLHVLLNGCYSAGELRNDDVRYEMLLKLLQRSHAEEQAAGEVMAAAMARGTKLPAYTYHTPNATASGGDGYLWVRNLLANRLYQSPVVFFEPYVMNSEEVWARVQLGDYEGEIELGGVKRKSLFREYADAVVDGVREYYLQARPR